MVYVLRELGSYILPPLRSSARATAIKAMRGTVAIKDVFYNEKGRPFPLRGRGSVPLTGDMRFPYGGSIPLRASFTMFKLSVEGLGPLIVRVPGRLYEYRTPARVSHVNFRLFSTMCPRHQFVRPLVAGSEQSQARAKMTALSLFSDFLGQGKKALWVAGGVSGLVGHHTWSVYQESPQQTKPKKGPKRKVHEFRTFS